jgi:hypothetical protein
MSVDFQRAVRQNIPLLIGIAGPTGGGKTMSALRIAKGLAGDKPFALIDTEAGRALHYADEFAFDHADLRAPFTPDRYAEAILAADEAGYPVIVVDSMSHEHAGDGGLLDMHEEKLTKLAGSDYRKRAAMTMLAWVEPKMSHKRLVTRLLQIRAHLIVCLRAEAKVEMVKNDKGETEIRPKRSLTGSGDGWIPIAEKSFPYELTMSLLVTPDAPGVPKPIKLAQAHRLIVPLNKPLSEDVGADLAAWAKGVDDENQKRIAALSARLLELADELGNRDATTAGIQENRTLHSADAGAHAGWLQTQVERFTAALEQKKAKATAADIELEPAAA